MSERSSGEEIVLAVEPDTEEWGSKNDRWQRDLQMLQQGLERTLPPGAVRQPAQAEGTMGLEMTEVLVSLSTSGTLVAVVEVIKEWLSQKPKVRRLRLTVRRGEETPGDPGRQ